MWARRDFKGGVGQALEAPSLRQHLASLTEADLLAAEERAARHVSSLPLFYRRTQQNHCLICLPREGDGLLGIGEHEAIVRLPDDAVFGHWVVKIGGVTRIPKIDGLYVSEGAPLGRYPNTLWETLDALHRSGLSAIIPPAMESCAEIGTYQIYKEYELEDRNQSSSFTVTPDLTLGGRYMVHEAQGFSFDSLVNGTKLKEQFHGDVKKVLAFRANPEYTFIIKPHRLEQNDPEYGVQRMFFVVVDPLTQRGDLVCGDLDHVQIRLTERHNLFLDAYDEFHDGAGDRHSEPLAIIPARILNSIRPFNP